MIMNSSTNIEFSTTDEGHTTPFNQLEALLQALQEKRYIDDYQIPVNDDVELLRNANSSRLRYVVQAALANRIVDNLLVTRIIEYLTQNEKVTLLSEVKDTDSLTIIKLLLPAVLNYPTYKVMIAEDIAVEDQTEDAEYHWNYNNLPKNKVIYAEFSFLLHLYLTFPRLEEEIIRLFPQQVPVLLNQIETMQHIQMTTKMPVRGDYHYWQRVDKIRHCNLYNLKDRKINLLIHLNDQQHKSYTINYQNKRLVEEKLIKEMNAINTLDQLIRFYNTHIQKHYLEQRRHETFDNIRFFFSKKLNYTTIKKNFILSSQKKAYQLLNQIRNPEEKRQQI